MPNKEKQLDRREKMLQVFQSQLIKDIVQKYEELQIPLTDDQKTKLTAIAEPIAKAAIYGKVAKKYKQGVQEFFKTFPDGLHFTPFNHVFLDIKLKYKNLEPIAVINKEEQIVRVIDILKQAQKEASDHIKVNPTLEAPLAKEEREVAVAKPLLETSEKKQKDLSSLLGEDPSMDNFDLLFDRAGFNKEVKIKTAWEKFTENMKDLIDKIPAIEMKDIGVKKFFTETIPNGMNSISESFKNNKQLNEITAQIDKFSSESIKSLKEMPKTISEKFSHIYKAFESLTKDISKNIHTQVEKIPSSLKTGVTNIKNNATTMVEKLQTRRASVEKVSGR